jgi:hypothetical protein
VKHPWVKSSGKRTSGSMDEAMLRSFVEHTEQKASDQTVTFPRLCRLIMEGSSRTFQERMALIKFVPGGKIFAIPAGASVPCLAAAAKIEAAQHGELEIEDGLSPCCMARRPGGIWPSSPGRCR